MRQIDSTALQLIVNFFYSGYIVVTGENVQVLLPAANLLQLQEVKDVCCDFLQSQLGPTNCIGIYDIADLHSCTKLSTSSELFIQRHFSEVVGGDEFLSLSSEQVIKLISSDELRVPSEEKIFESVIRWVKYELDSRNYILPQLMEHVMITLVRHYIFIDSSQEILFHKTSDINPDMEINCWWIFYFKSNKIGFYDPKMNLWHNGPTMGRSRNNPCLAVVRDNLVFAVGGSTHDFKPLRSVDVLDLSAESPRWKPSVDMLHERHIFGVGVIDNNLYAVSAHNFSDPELATVEVFDCNTQEWRMMYKMSTRSSDPGVGVLNNLLYVVGGFDISSRQVLDTVECFDPSLDTWTPVANMSVGRRSAGVGVLDGVLYAVGGKDRSNILSSVEAYRPSTGVWTTVAAMNLPRSLPGVIALDGSMYVIGGFDCTSLMKYTECYSPKTNIWTKVTTPKYFAHYTSGGVAINRPRHIKTC
eukprot:XP_016658366.1 PREDICTED: kelch-like protein 2 [Acyrthosiphon pisum]